MNLYLDGLLQRIRKDFLPCKAVSLQSSLIRSLKQERIVNKAFSDAFSFRKTITLNVLLLLPVCLGHSVLFGQATTVPDIKASVSGKLTCKNTSVKLKGSSKTLGAYYTWTGPGGFTSTAQEPVTAMPGDYTITVKDPLHGGTATATVKVSVDTIAPAGIKATVSGLLTCKDTLVTLAGFSSTPEVSFGWKGPKNFTSAIKNPVVATPGTYVLTATNPANGCMASANLGVRQDIRPPSGITVNASGKLTCNATSVTLTGTSATQDVRYHWTGPVSKPEVNKTDVSAPGAYVLVVTNPENGCSSKAGITVTQDVTVPAQVMAFARDTLTCKTAKTTLSVSSSTKSVSYRWTGPNAFASTEQSAETNMTGVYTVEVTNPENGCFVKKQVTVIRDTTPPVAVLATVSGILTCKNKTVTLKGSSSTPKVYYTWSGPANFSSASPAPSVSLPGRYEVKVAKTANGCPVSKVVQVEQDTIAPQGLAASVSDSISCKVPTVLLNGSATSKQVIFTWIGPQGFKANEKSPGVKIPGRYTLTVTNTGNGCMSNKTVTVAGNACTGNKQ